MFVQHDHYLAFVNKMDPDSTWIEELWKSNHAPSAEAAEEVRGLLRKPLKELEDLDVEILALRNRLSELESKRNETQKRISRYKSILSPIRRVFPDVLGEIFYRCLPTHRNPIMKSTDCPLLLTRVCSIWRTTAISTPKLWDRLYITFTDDDTIPDLETAIEMVRNREVMDYRWRDAPPKAIKEHTTALLRRRYEAVREWFLRSGTRPLSISICLTTSTWYTVPYSERSPSVLMELFSFLASLAPRWKEFSVRAPHGLYRTLEDMLPPVSQMAVLTSLKINDPVSRYWQDTESSQPPKLLATSNLRKLRIFGDISNVIWGAEHRSFIQWDKLTHFTYHRFLSTSDTIFILEHASNLIEYTTHISDSPRVDVLSSTSGGSLSLPNLRRLSITDNNDPKRMGALYDSIDAPKLQWVKYAERFHDNDEYSGQGSVSIPILSLLRKSTELESLAVDASDFPVCDIGALLRAIPSVTHLVLGNEKGKPGGDTIMPAAYIDYDAYGTSKPHIWSVADFIVDNTSGDLENGPSETLLPRLTSLVIASRTINTSDDILFDVIKSRMTSKKTSVLSRVKARFHRERERNIVEELTTCAEDVGVKIDLDFGYAEKTPSFYDPTSPEFAYHESEVDE